MKSNLLIPTVALLMCCCLCCTSKSADEQQEGVQLSQVKLNLKSPIECKGGQTLSCSFISGYGPLATDEIVLRRESMDDVVLPMSLKAPRARRTSLLGRRKEAPYGVL